MMIFASARPIIEITGAPANVTPWGISPAIGKTTLALMPGRVSEQTQYRVLGLEFGTRHCELQLSALDAVELSEQGNPMLLVAAGVLLPFTFGIGSLMCLGLFVAFRKRYFILRSGSATLAIALDNAMDKERARAFVEELGHIRDRELVRA